MPQNSSNSPYHLTTQTLAKYYTNGDLSRLYHRHDVTHPLIWLPAPEAQRDDVDSVIGRLVLGEKPPFAFYDHGYLQTMQNKNKTLFNGITFDMKQIRTRPKLQIDLWLGQYFDMLATSTALKNELEVHTKAPIRLPSRTQYHRKYDPEQSLMRGQGRGATIGAAILIVINHQGTYKAMLARRSQHSGTDPGKYHLLPAFIFQPNTTDVRPYELSLRYHIMREYMEELFGMEEDFRAPDELSQHPAMQDLEMRLERGSASLYLTGIALNLVNLRPEIGGLLLIHDADWYDTVTATDALFPLTLEAETLDGQATLVPIHDDEAVLDTLPNAYYERMPQQGIVAMWEGIDLARKQIKNYQQSL